MKIIKADLIERFKLGDFDAIAHGCNCFCKMRSGVAKAVSDAFPEANHIDYYTTKGDINKLGTYTVVKVLDKKYIYNLYTQYNYGYDGKLYLYYDALSLCFKKLNHTLKGLSLGIPKLGCGLAGGDWKIVKKIIEQSCPDLDITVCYL